MKQTSMDIIREIQDLQDRWETELTDTAGEITEKIEQIEKTLLESREKAVDKITNIKRYCQRVREQQAALGGLIEYHNSKISEFRKAQKSLEGQIDRMKKITTILMDRAEIESLKVDNKKIYFRTFESLHVEDDEKATNYLPDGMWETKITYKVDKKAVKEALKNMDHSKITELKEAGIELVESRTLIGIDK